MLSRFCAAAAVAVALLCPLDVSVAEEKKAPDPEKIFKRKDANGDGMLTLDEFKTGLKDKPLEMAEKRFGKMDSNGDGKLSLDEFKASFRGRSAS